MKLCNTCGGDPASTYGGCVCGNGPVITPKQTDEKDLDSVELTGSYELWNAPLPELQVDASTYKPRPPAEKVRLRRSYATPLTTWLLGFYLFWVGGLTGVLANFFGAFAGIAAFLVLAFIVYVDANKWSDWASIWAIVSFFAFFFAPVFMPIYLYKSWRETGVSIIPFIASLLPLILAALALIVAAVFLTFSGF